MEVDKNAAADEEAVETHEQGWPGIADKDPKALHDFPRASISCCVQGKDVLFRPDAAEQALPRTVPCAKVVRPLQKAFREAPMCFGRQLELKIASINAFVRP